MRKPVLIAALLAMISLPSHAAERICPAQPQRMPAAIESAELPATEAFSNIITFSATPSLETPQRAWVIQLFQRVRGQPATLRVVRLLGRYDCNIYDVEARWEVPFNSAEFESVATSLVPYLTAPKGTFAPGDGDMGRHLVTDGTSLDLRGQTSGWEVRRWLNHSQSEGATLSATFFRLLAIAVPAPERPEADWRARN